MSESRRSYRLAAERHGRRLVMPDTITPTNLGLRERKKQKTRESIQCEAMRLFQKQGYEETTIEQIAAALGSVVPAPR